MSEARWGFLAGIVAIGALSGAAGALAVNQIYGGGSDAAVRGYLLQHPEVIPEAMQRLQEREMAKVVGENRAAIFTPYGSAFAGNPKGDVTLVEYFDYNCGYCRASLPMLHDLVASDSGLKIVFRELPILSEESRTAARASLTAAEQGKFAGFHDALYESGPLSDDRIAAVARGAGVDLSKASMTKADAEISRNRDIAGRLGMTGTPGWVIGDRVFSGALPIEEMKKAIAAARAKT
ncbi:DsbA family protein [soil metagenome]